MPATQTPATAAILAAFTLGFTTRKTARGNSPEAKAQRAGATQRKITNDHDRACASWLALEVYWSGSASTSVATQSGMRTNGGCRCLTDDRDGKRLYPRERAALRAAHEAATKVLTDAA